MKKLWLISILLTIVGGIHADNLNVADFELTAGEEKAIDIELINPDKMYTAFQFDLVLPEGVSISKNKKNKLIVSLDEDRLEDHSLSVEDIGSGTYRFISFSLTNAEYYEQSGALIHLTVKAADGITEGAKTATITEQTFTETNGTQHNFSDLTFKITVPGAVVPKVQADDKTRKYGEVNPELTYQVTEGELTGIPELTTTATQTSPVGTYPIVVNKGTIEGNYEAINGTLTITKSSLTITAKSYTITQGDALPTFEAEYSGFKNNETADVLTKKPVFTTSVTSSSEPGTFDIIVSGAEAQNYEISYVKGTLTINPGVYKLKYMVDGEVYKTYDVKYGETITPEPAPTKEGYTFSGWSEIPATMPAKDVIVTGTFTINTYKLIYKVDNEVYKTIDVKYGETITPEAAPTKEGYTFSGWSEIPATMPAKDVIVTGTFAINTYKLTYMVDNEVYKTIDVKYGETITPEAAPTKEGYTFSGWSEIPATMPAKDVIVTGTFTINTYKLIYKVDNEVYKTIDVKYGETITPEAAPTKEGYTFSGWSEIPATMPAKDVIVTGTFAINTYKLTYMVDNEVYKTYDVKYGETITPEAAPTKEGYTFSGWSEIPATMPAHDVTVTGTFTLDTGINQIMSDENGNAMIFTIDGKRVNKPQKNLNIIRMKDGTTRKVMMK